MTMGMEQAGRQRFTTPDNRGGGPVEDGATEISGRRAGADPAAERNWR